MSVQGLCSNVQNQVAGVLARMLYVQLSDMPPVDTGAPLPSLSAAKPADSASAMQAKTQTNRALASAISNPSFHSTKPGMEEAGILHEGVAIDAAGLEAGSSNVPMDATAAGEGPAPDALQASAWNAAVDTAMQHEGVQKEMRLLDAAGVSCHLLAVACSNLCSTLLFRARLRAHGVLCVWVMYGHCMSMFCLEPLCRG
jgi:hypothetical protein